MTKFLALLSLFVFLPSRKILKCPVRTSSTNLRLQHIILQLKNIRINPPLESFLSLTTFIQNAAICSSILTTLLFSFFKRVLRPCSHHTAKQRRRRAYAIAHRHPLRSLRMLVRMRAMLASLTSELNWFQSLGPRNEIDFCPFDVVRRGTRKSASVFLSLIVVTAEFCTNSSNRLYTC